eukprot:51997_1
MFGGYVPGKCADTICVLNVKSVDDGWIELKDIKCPTPSYYLAVVDAMDHIHILGNKQHYSISTSSVLKDILDNEDEEEKHDTQAEEVNEDHKKAIDVLRTENAHLQSLVEDLLNNNKTEELAEATKPNE